MHTQFCCDAKQKRSSMSSSYRPKGYGVSPALRRAREPYRIRNGVTGGLLVAFAVSVWAYSISAVKQDNFDDVDALALDQRRNTNTASSTQRSVRTSRLVALY
ncbi:hypothetical protein DL93DRAFT_2058949 [Clavulina sp. PMI_390]|nr:hypothetical protein DL93DRAFT_2058949 [Clavulina sp. PMI_390]